MLKHYGGSNFKQIQVQTGTNTVMEEQVNTNTGRTNEVGPFESYTEAYEAAEALIPENAWLTDYVETISEPEEGFETSEVTVEVRSSSIDTSVAMEKAKALIPAGYRESSFSISSIEPMKTASITSNESYLTIADGLDQVRNTLNTNPQVQGYEEVDYTYVTTSNAGAYWEGDNTVTYDISMTLSQLEAYVSELAKAKMLEVIRSYTGNSSVTLSNYTFTYSYYNVTVYFNSSGTKIGQIYYKQGSSTPVLTNWDPGYSQSNVDSSRTEQTTAVGVSRVDATCSVGYKVTLNVMKPGRITGFYYYIKPGVYKGYAEYEYETTILVPREVPVYEMKWVEE